MASDAVYDAVKDYLTAQWTTSPIQWPNEPQIDTTDPTTRGDPNNPPRPAPWVLFQITGTLYGQESIGAETQAANRWDEAGLIWFHVVVPAGTGGSVVRRHAKQLADLFRGTTLLSGSLMFGDARLGEGQAGNVDGSEYVVSVSLDWRYIEA